MAALDMGAAAASKPAVTYSIMTLAFSHNRKREHLMSDKCKGCRRCSLNHPLNFSQKSGKRAMENAA